MNDVYIESIPIPDGTPEEMVKFYVETVNKAHAERRSGFSKRYAEVMDVSVSNDWVVEFKGQKFLCLEWRTVRFASKEEFFGEDEE